MTGTVNAHVRGGVRVLVLGIAGNTVMKLDGKGLRSRQSHQGVRPHWWDLHFFLEDFYLFI